MKYRQKNTVLLRKQKIFVVEQNKNKRNIKGNISMRKFIYSLNVHK